MGTSGVTRDRVYKRDELHRVSQRLEELAAVDTGFDLRIDPTTRKLVLAYPKQGLDLSASVVFDGRNILSANVVFSIAEDDVASDSFATGTSEGATLYSTRSNATTRSTFGRCGVAGNFDGVTQQATLDGYAQALVDARAEQLLVPGPTLRPVPDADVGDFAVGDVVKYAYDAGLGVQTGNYRIAKLTTSLDKDGQERMSVEFA